MKQGMKEFMEKVSEDEGLRVKLEALAGLPEDCLLYTSDAADE